MAAFQEAIARTPLRDAVFAPDVVAAASSKKVLTTRWVEGRAECRGGGWLWAGVDKHGVREGGEALGGVPAVASAAADPTPGWRSAVCSPVPPSAGASLGPGGGGATGAEQRGGRLPAVLHRHELLPQAAVAGGGGG